MPQMSEKRTALLIERVRKHPSLYDATHNSYKNLTLRAKRKIWENIGAEMNVTGEVARKKWRSLRDNYMRHRKEIITGQPAKKFGKWHWASHLQFLDLTSAEQRRSSNVSRNSETLEEPDTPAQVRKSTFSQKKDINDMDKLIDFIQNKKKTNCDAIDNLFKSYAQLFKTFSLKNQIMFKVELAKLFSEIELKELEERAQVGVINVTQTTSRASDGTTSQHQQAETSNDCDNELDVFDEEKINDFLH